MTASHKRPEPLITSAKVTATISGLVSLLVTLGIFPVALGQQLDTVTKTVVAAVGLVVSTVPVIVHAVQARKSVTPNADPRNVDGVRLVPVTALSVGPPAVAALALADVIAPMAPVETSPVDSGPAATPSAPVAAPHLDPYTRTTA